MKQTVKTKLHEGTLGGDELRMGIHADAVGHITGVLTKMYANPLLACIREYSTNAWDSHVEAGNDSPIEVELPSATEPRLRIRDWGVGLDEQGIREIYSQYGASTKRNTNAQNGMLGIGCKSALAYTDQFTVTAVRGGTMTQVLVSYDEDGAGKMTLLGNKIVDNIPDGVEVSIPIKSHDIDLCRKLAGEFYKFWPAEHVLLDGHQPSGFKELNGLWLDEHTLLTDAVDEDLVVMGKVAYPLVDGEKPLFPAIRYRNAYHAVCFVPIGSVSFAPSRESLMTTKRTTETLATLRDKVSALRDKSVQEQIANAATASEAQDLLVKGHDIGFSGTATWQGQEVVLFLKREPPSAGSGGGYWQPDEAPVDQALKHSYLSYMPNRYGRKNGERCMQVDLKRADTIFFVGFDGKALTNVKRAKLDQWWSQQPASTVVDNLTGIPQSQPLPHSIFVDKLSMDEAFWLTGRSIYQWSNVDAIVLPKTTAADGTTKRIAGSYDTIVKGDYRDGVPASELVKRTEPLYWYHGNRWTTGHAPEIRSGAIKLADCIVVCLSRNRIEKFCRDFPRAVNLTEAAKALAAKWDKAQDKEVAKAYWIQQECDVQALKKLPIVKLDDPDLKTLVKIANVATDAYARGRKEWSRYLAAHQHDKDVAWANKVLSKYPLYLGRYGAPHTDHLILYFNAAFAAERS